MSMSDPVADMLTRIRNGQRAEKKSVLIPFSRMKESLCKVLHEEGYINNFTVLEVDKFKQIEVNLRYVDGEPGITSIRRVSKPSLRIYRKFDDMPVAMNGFGTVIVSTPKGLVSDKKARS